jgi:inner membrane transporter RhtA
MARLSRATYALLLSLLPATATVIGILVLAQLPKAQEVLGIALVILGVAVHRERAEKHSRLEETAGARWRRHHFDQGRPHT